MKQKKLLLSDYGIRSSDNVLTYRLDRLMYYVGLIEVIFTGVLAILSLIIARSFVVFCIMLMSALLGVFLILGYRNCAYFYSDGIILVRGIFGNVTKYNCDDVVKVYHSFRGTTTFKFTNGKKIIFDMMETEFVNGVMKAEKLSYEYCGDRVIKIRYSKFAMFVSCALWTGLLVACFKGMLSIWLCIPGVSMLLMDITTVVEYNRDTHMLARTVLFNKKSYDLTEHTVALYWDDSMNRYFLNVCKGDEIIYKLKLNCYLPETWELCNALGLNIKFKGV